MCDGRPMPQSLSASRDRSAHPAGDHCAAGHAALFQNAVQAEGGEVVGEQEQAAELRAQRPGPQVQLALVRDGGGLDAALLRPASA